MAPGPPRPGLGFSGGVPAPTPRGSVLMGATRPHAPGFTFGRPKVNRKTAKTKVLDSLSQSVCINRETALPLNIVFYLICNLAVNDTSPAGLLKGDMFLLVLDETWFLRRTLGSIHRNLGQVSSIRGYPKGGRCPPLCRRGGGVHRGGTPSKGSRPYACFWLLFARAKSNSGCGAESPIRFRKETCFFPAHPAMGESKPIGQMRWRSRCETGSPARRQAHQPFGAGDPQKLSAS